MLATTHRFHGHNSLNGVYRTGRVIHGQSLTLRFGTNPRRRNYRVAVVVSRKVAKSAVVRNRIRRRVYEIIRNSSLQPGGYDLVFTVFSDQLAILPAPELQRLVCSQLGKAGILETKI